MDSDTGIIAIDQGGEWGKSRSTCLGGRLALWLASCLYNVINDKYDHQQTRQ